METIQNKNKTRKQTAAVPKMKAGMLTSQSEFISNNHAQPTLAMCNFVPYLQDIDHYLSTSAKLVHFYT